MKKRAIKILLIIILLIAFPVTVNADMGPKPSVVIDFIGLEGETYYAALISSVASYGPNSAIDDDHPERDRYKEDDELYEIFRKFAEYVDDDGYFFLQYFKDCSQIHQFDWTYYPPEDFKVLLYFPQTDSFIVSNSNYERYAFDSYFTAEVKVQESADSAAQLVLTKSYNYTGEITSLIIRILLTIGVELIIALLFGFRCKKQFQFIAIVNTSTQVILNIALNLISYYAGAQAFIFYYFVLEFGIFIIEAIAYKMLMKNEVPTSRIWLYSLTANAASFALGVNLASWIPNIF